MPLVEFSQYTHFEENTGGLCALQAFSSLIKDFHFSTRSFRFSTSSFLFVNYRSKTKLYAEIGKVLEETENGYFRKLN